ncbi:MAG: HDOD domain-containing protein [Verrucomicrobiota bacterium]
MTALAPIHLSIQDHLDQGHLELPVLPEVATKVVQLCSNPDSTPGEIHDLIRRDQSLAANLLRISNSAMYSPGFEIKTLEQAVSRLGFKRVKEATLIISCEGRVFQVKRYETQVRQLFRHCLAASAFAEEVARQGRRNVEEAFLCGLMHDIGCPVLLQFVADLEKKQQTTYDIEEVLPVVSHFHANVGGMLAERWNLPDRLAEAIRYHHTPDEAKECVEIARLTNLANDLAHFAVGPKERTEQQIQEHPMLVHLNIYPDELDTILAKKDQIIDMVGVLS